ncbi:unnamed protein product, partial [Didymodactylos carnosus]
MSLGFRDTRVTVVSHNYYRTLNYSYVLKSADESWTHPALASCFVLKWIASYLIVVFILGLLTNGFVLYLFFKEKHLRNPTNTHLICLSATDFSAALLGIPLSLSSNFSCRWLFGKYGCYYEGFVAYWAGITDIYLLAAISVN